jgi:hypothetical protein
MTTTSAQFEHYLRRFVVTIVVVLFLCIAIDWSYWQWAERGLAVTVVYANGQPASGFHVSIQRIGDPLDAIPWTKAGPQRSRIPTRRIGIRANGTWESENPVLYGRYILRVYRMLDIQTVEDYAVHQQEFYVPLFDDMTHVQVVLDEPVAPTTQAPQCVPPPERACGGQSLAGPTGY